jgi:2-polyprenyl-3-methyl-5-hydroxy-6-metoxy-1,4-benzoquinol methylase
VAFEQLKARQAEVWGSAPFERVADNTSDMNDRLIALLGVRSGERWLDLTTGTGSAAIIAARRGAAVTGQDLAPRLIETARRLVAEQGTEIEFEVGDCEQLPYPDGSFDVVSSAIGAVLLVAEARKRRSSSLARAKGGGERAESEGSEESAVSER